jgi:hypothetical protein
MEFSLGSASAALSRQSLMLFLITLLSVDAWWMLVLGFLRFFSLVGRAPLSMLIFGCIFHFPETF